MTTVDLSSRDYEDLVKAVQTRALKPQNHPYQLQCLRIYSSFPDSFQGSERIAGILSMASTFGPHLQDLEIHAYYLPPDDLPIVALVSLLRECRQLKRLKLFQLRLTCATPRSDVLKLANVVESLDKLEDLTWEPLPSPTITSEQGGTEPLLQSISHLKSLRVLQLTEDPTFPGQSTCRWIKPLMHQSVTSLQLSNWTLTWEACGHISSGLQTNNTLVSLDLSSSYILSEQGALLILAALVGNTSLKRLNLRYCKVREGSDNDEDSSSSASYALAKTLLDILETQNTTLEWVQADWMNDGLDDSTAMGITTSRLLALNRTGMRHHLEGSVSVWPYVLEKASAASPTALWPLIRQNMDRFLN